MPAFAAECNSPRRKKTAARRSCSAAELTMRKKTGSRDVNIKVKTIQAGGAA
jgi:hypothetical protein